MVTCGLSRRSHHRLQPRHCLSVWFSSPITYSSRSIPNPVLAMHRCQCVHGKPHFGRVLWQRADSGGRWLQWSPLPARRWRPGPVWSGRYARSACVPSRGGHRGESDRLMTPGSGRRRHQVPPFSPCRRSTTRSCESFQRVQSYVDGAIIGLCPRPAAVRSAAHTWERLSETSPLERTVPYIIQCGPGPTLNGPAGIEEEMAINPANNGARVHLRR